MACLFKRNGSKYWWIKDSVDGKEIRFSTETAKRRDAERALARYETQRKDGTYKKPTNTSLEVLLSDYLDHYKAKSCPNPAKPRKTFNTVASRLNQFFGIWLEENHPHIQALEQISPAIITDFLNHKRNEDGVSPKTYNHYRQVLYTLFEFAIKKNGFVSRDARYPNPVSATERLTELCSEIQYLTIPQIRNQLDLLTPGNLKKLKEKNKRIKQYKPWIYLVLQPMVATLIYAGLRREELLWLTPKDVDLKKRMIYVRAKTVAGEFWQPKTKKNRSVPISSSLLEYLSAYNPPKGSSWYFPYSTNGRWDPDNFSKAVREFNRAGGLCWISLNPETEEEEHRPWSSLDFRHTFGSQLAMKGETLYKISALMGNSPEVCRRHYAHLMPERLRDCVEFDVEEEPTPKKPTLKIIRLDDYNKDDDGAIPAS